MPIHHIIPRSRGGSDDEWNLVEWDEYTHAYEHAMDFVLFEKAPMFHFGMQGWNQLHPDLQAAVRAESSRRLSVDNPSHDPKVLAKKKETFEKRGTHNFCTPEGRKRNSERAAARNRTHNVEHNRSPKMRQVTLENNKVRCCCLICKKECSRPGMGRHLQTHDTNHESI